MTTSFDDTDLSFDDGEDDGVDIPPTNDVAATRQYDEINVSADAFWDLDLPERDATFARLRRDRPISWQPPVETSAFPDPDDPGFWAVVRHQDIIEVSQHDEVFVSRYGMMFDTLPPVFLEMATSFLSMDDPKHNKVRRLVVAAFTPRQIRRIEDDIASRARRIVATAAERAAAGQPVDFVEDISMQLPQEMFCSMFGIPEELRLKVGRAADETMAWADPVLLAGRDPVEVQVEATSLIHEIAADLIAQRREKPENDLLTALMRAEVDGEKLSDFEIGAVMVLFAVAGTDTTRHTASFAAKALTDFPEQRGWLWEDFDNRIASAIEEFLRWGSVVMTFRRTAVTEYVLNGQQILPGDKVVMMYASGNRDADVFDNPDTFDLSRHPNPHIAFGGGGVHYCLGTHLARSMLRALFRELHRLTPDFSVGEPELVRTNFIRGVVSMPFEANTAPR